LTQTLAAGLGLELAEVALLKNDAAECKKLALRVVLDHPESRWLDTAYFLCGKASEELKEPNQAIGYYRKLLADRPQSERLAAARERLIGQRFRQLWQWRGGRRCSGATKANRSVSRAIAASAGSPPASSAR